MTAFLHELGGISIFATRAFRTYLTTKGNFQPIMAQIADVSYRSLSTIAFSGLFVGAILVVQFGVMLSNYDALSMLGGINTSSIVREVGPLIISFLLAGKIGAYTAAELGTMRVTQQIDAIECLGTNPIQYLIVPRIVAIVVSSMILLTIGLLVSVLGSVFVADLVYGINSLRFASSIPRFVDGWTFFSGFFKCAVYSFIVAGVSCYKGYTASGGARGVGRAVTQAAVYTNLYIILANYITSRLLAFTHEFGGAVLNKIGGILSYVLG